MAYISSSDFAGVALVEYSTNIGSVQEFPLTSIASMIQLHDGTILVAGGSITTMSG